MTAARNERDRSRIVDSQPGRQQTRCRRPDLCAWSLSSQMSTSRVRRVCSLLVGLVVARVGDRVGAGPVEAVSPGPAGCAVSLLVFVVG